MKKKKDETQTDYLGNKITKPSAEEWVAMISFALILILTMNYGIAVVSMIFITAGYFMIKQTIIATKTHSKKFFRRLSITSKVLLILFLILFIIDEILTWVAVWYLKFAIETNLFSVLLWRVFGYALGEFIRVSLIFLVFYYLWIFASSKNERMIFISLMFSTTGFLLWLFAIINNVSVLANYLAV